MTEYICKEVQTDNGGYLEPVTELIRCKDCKHSLHNQFTGDWYCWLYNIAREIESDGFCYKAERKEEENGRD